MLLVLVYFVGILVGLLVWQLVAVCLLYWSAMLFYVALGCFAFGFVYFGLRVITLRGCLS